MDYFNNTYTFGNINVTKFQWPTPYGFLELKAMWLSLFLSYFWVFLTWICTITLCIYLSFWFSKHPVAMSYTIKLCLFALFWVTAASKYFRWAPPLFLHWKERRTFIVISPLPRLSCFCWFLICPPAPFFSRWRICLCIFTICFCKIFVRSCTQYSRSDQIEDHLYNSRLMLTKSAAAQFPSTKNPFCLSLRHSPACLLQTSQLSTHHC